ncbi:MAG: hypothetical protein HC944_04965 [Nanoarchaeota archaeon]|nr:hypothetical protein [Nanoarchaeota archaeon]
MKLCTTCFAIFNFLAIVNSWQQLRFLFAVSVGSEEKEEGVKNPNRSLFNTDDVMVQIQSAVESNYTETTLDEQNPTSSFEASFLTPGQHDSDKSMGILAGLIDGISSIPDSTLTQLIELNCQYQVAVHILTSLDSANTDLEARRAQYESCAPFVVLQQDARVRELFPNRIDRIAYLRDVQRASIRRHFVDGLVNDSESNAAALLSQSVVIVMDLDLKGIPTNKQLVQEMDIMSQDVDGTDVLCASGQMFNPIGYYDIFATVLSPHTFPYPLAGRLVEKFMPGEDPSMVRSNDMYGGFTQLDLLDFFEKEALHSPDGTVPVKSCFGGLTLYRGSTFFQSNCRYSVDTKHLSAFANKEDARPCEHVAFHDCLLTNDRSTYIAVKPTLKTYWDEPSPPKMPSIRICHLLIIALSHTRSDQTMEQNLSKEISLW